MTKQGMSTLLFRSMILWLDSIEILLTGAQKGKAATNDSGVNHQKHKF